MKFGPLVFLAAFLALSASWCGFVLTPQVQLGRAVQETNSLAKAELYPAGRPGSARQGLEVYRANGCAYCHSQQVEQKGTVVEVILTDVGTNANGVAEALNDAHIGTTFMGPVLGAALPKPILRGATMEAATSLINILKKTGARGTPRIVPVGSDMERGWGTRRTVAEDFIFDATVMLGSQRVGPDLANVGARLPDMNWQLMHLYAPRAITTGSPMPSYPFLFEQKKIGKEPSPDALQLPKEFAPREGYEIVPKPEAKELAAYLLSLRSETPLFEAPITPPTPPAATNAPAK